MINTFMSVSVDTTCLEPFEDRIDILFRELELATKWQRPSVLLAVYSSEYVRADADIALENRLHDLGQSAYHIKVKNPQSADVAMQISQLANLDNLVFFVEGLRWGSGEEISSAYQMLNNRREFFIEKQIRVVLWLTEKEAIDLAHFAPDYWSFRHRVIEFVDSPKPDQIAPHILESAWQGTDDLTDSTEDLDAKIALRTALLTDLPSGNESTSARANLLLTLGVLHWRRGDYEKATRFLNTALDMAARLEDNCFEAMCFNAIALVNTDQGRPEEAIQAYQNAIGLAPEQISPWNNLGHLYKKLGRDADALAAFQKAIDQNPSDAVAWNGLGHLYNEAGRHDDAIYAYLKAIEFAPDYALSWSGLGDTFMEKGCPDDALAAHKKAIELDSGMVNSWHGLGDIYKKQGNNENASMAYQTALELDPQNTQAWNRLGSLYFEAGAYDQALRSYKKCIESDQGGCQIYNNLASIYVHKGQHAEAIPLLLNAIEKADDTTDVACLCNRLGDAYRQLEDYDHAIAAYRKADELALAKAGPQAEPPALSADPQVAATEEAPNQVEAQLENDPVDEEPLQPVKEEPAQAELPELTFIDWPHYMDQRQDPEISATRQHTEFVSWLDGLASVMPVNSPSEPTEVAGSIAAEAGQKESIAEVGSIPQPDIEQSLSSDQVECEALPACDQTPALAETAEEVEDTLPIADQVDMPQAGACQLDEPASRSCLAEGAQVCETQSSIDEKNAQIWNELGNIYYNSGAFDEAMHAFEMAIELDPSYGWSYNNLASIYFHQKRYGDAIPLYQKGLQFLDDCKDKALLWNRLGDAYRRLDDHTQAAAAYRKAIELDSDNVSLLTRARFSLLGNLRV